MTPFNRDGDRLTIAPLSGGRPRRGDVAAYFQSVETHPRLVVHRILRRHGTGLVVQGDAGGREPEIVPPEAVVGRVDRVQRDGRDIRFGLGPERLLLAWLSRTRLLWTVIWPLRRLIGRVFDGKTSAAAE
jgi:hypothetical protein